MPPAVLITGAAGFVGTRLSHALLADGYEVRALVRPAHDSRRLEERGARIIRGDAADRALVTRAATGCAVLYHLAAARGAHKLSYRAYHQRNCAMVEAVAHAACAGQVGRLVAASTATLVGGRVGQSLQTEETPKSSCTASPARTGSRS